MDCNLIRLDLAGFHFGEIDAEPRRRLEAHLLACPACLQAFLALKRRIEAAEGRFSETGRARLRAAVERQVAPRPKPSWPWWQRPLAVALAAAAVLFAASTVSVLAASPGGAPHAWPKPGERVPGR